MLWPTLRHHAHLCTVRQCTVSGTLLRLRRRQQTIVGQLALSCCRQLNQRNESSVSRCPTPNFDKCQTVVGLMIWLWLPIVCCLSDFQVEPVFAVWLFQWLQAVLFLVPRPDRQRSVLLAFAWQCWLQWQRLVFLVVWLLDLHWLQTVSWPAFLRREFV